MKRTWGIMLIAALIALLAACGNGAASDGDNSEKSFPKQAVMLDAGEWPQNEYTAEIPQPDSGMVSQGWIDPDIHCCYIDMTGVSSGAMKSWYSLLLDDGFVEVEKTVEEIEGQNYTSTNALLQKDGVFLSITHLSTAEGELEICITKE